MAVSISSLLARYTADEIALARQTQDAQIRAGAPRRSITEILAGHPAAPRSSAPVEDLTARQLRRRGSLGQAALLTEQAALAEKDSAKADRMRYHATALRALATPNQIEFDFFGGGNVSIGHEFIDAVQNRLKSAGTTPAERDAALATLLLIVRHLSWQTYDCSKTAAELADIRGIAASHMSKTLSLLESVGAVTRVKRGRQKVITITPEGAFRGDVNKHAEAVARYRAEVVPIRPAAPA